MRSGGVQRPTALGELAIGNDLCRWALMVEPEQGGQPGTGLGAQVEVDEGQIPVEAAAQLLIQLVDGRRDRKVTAKHLLKIRSFTWHIVNQQDAACLHRQASMVLINC